MKKLLFIFLCIPFIGLGQLNTNIPDVNFEQALINLGHDNILDGSVSTSNIDTLTSLNVSWGNISDLTGIEDFTSLTYLVCGNNQLTSLNVSNNTKLTHLGCGNNQLTSLDVTNNIELVHLAPAVNQLTSLNITNNPSLTYLNCQVNQLTSLDVSSNKNLITLMCAWNNQITSLDVTKNTLLETLDCDGIGITTLDVSSNPLLTWISCYDNQLTSLDVSNNTVLTILWCYNNQLTSLDIRNGNNTNMTYVWIYNNPNLTCINVDDSTYSTNNWFTIDPQHYFSNNCGGTTAIYEVVRDKTLIKIINMLGQEVKPIPNIPLFYVYSDGTIEKKIIK